MSGSLIAGITGATITDVGTPAAESWRSASRRRDGVAAVGRAFLCRLPAPRNIAPAVGEPGCAVGPDDYALRCRILPERNSVDVSGHRSKPPSNAGTLPCVPDLAGRARCHVVRKVAFLQLIVRRSLSSGYCGKERQQGTNEDHETHSRLLLSLSASLPLWFCKAGVL